MLTAGRHMKSGYQRSIHQRLRPKKQSILPKSIDITIYSVSQHHCGKILLSHSNPNFGLLSLEKSLDSKHLSSDEIISTGDSTVVHQ